METRKKLSLQKAEELKEKIKNRLEDNLDSFQDDEDYSIDEIAQEIGKLSTNKELHDFLEDVHDVDIAEYLEEKSSDIELLRIFESLAPEDRAAIVESANEELQIRILNLIDEEEILEIFSYMSPDDIADILGIVQFHKSKSLLNKMKRSEANKLRELLGYDVDTAGGIMTTQYIAFKKNIKIKEVLEKIKIIAPKTEYIETIFVLDTNGEILGEADLRDILISPDYTLLEEITDENIKYVYADDDQEEVAQLVSKYGLKVVPVLSKRKKILGIITIDDVVDVIQEEFTEDILKLAQTADDEELTTPLWGALRKRMPWLIINLATAFLASFSVAMFEDTINKVVALAVAMPIVSGMGGNAGTQSLAVTIRAIALGEYKEEDRFMLITKYFLQGLISGSVLGIFGGIIIYFMFGKFYLSCVIFLAMIGDLVVGCVIGFLIPIILKALRIDPALASSVILTTFTDICGFVFFLGIATIMLPKLI